MSERYRPDHQGRWSEPGSKGHRGQEESHHTEDPALQVARNFEQHSQELLEVLRRANAPRAATKPELD